MFASISHMDVQLWVPLGATLIIASAIVAVIGFFQWRKVRMSEMEATLKQQMFDRGMTADEITRVLTATSKREF